MYRQMQYFVAVVETGSFSEAAERCHISQSAISQQIRALEDDLQVELLRRRGRRFEVAPAGMWFYQQARRQLSEMDSTVREVRRIGKGEHQQLRIGVLTGFSPRTVQGALGDFASSHPNVQMWLVSGTHEEIFQKVVAGQLDMVINDQRRALADHFINVELGEQPLCALLGQDRPMARQAAVTLEMLRDVPCIVVAPQPQRENETVYWRDMMAFRGDLLFVDNMETAILNAVAGMGWLPCDRDVDVHSGVAPVPLYRGSARVVRRMFAFWPEAVDAPLQWEFAEALTRHFK